LQLIVKPFYMVFTSALVLFSLWIATKFNPNVSSLDINTSTVVSFLIPIVIYSLVIVRLQIRKNRRFLITIDDYSITLEQQHFGKKRVSFRDVREIRRNADGSYYIIGTESEHFINIPSGIEDKENLERRLNEIALISENDMTGKGMSNRFPPFLLPILFVVIILFTFSGNKILSNITPIFPALIIGVLFFFYYRKLKLNGVKWQAVIRSFKHMPRGQWIFLVILIVLILTNIINSFRH